MGGTELENGGLILSDENLGIYHYSISLKRLTRLVSKSSSGIVNWTKFGDVEFSSKGDIFFINRGIFDAIFPTSKFGQLFVYHSSDGTIEELYRFVYIQGTYGEVFSFSPVNIIYQTTWGNETGHPTDAVVRGDYAFFTIYLTLISGGGYTLGGHYLADIRSQNQAGIINSEFYHVTSLEIVDCLGAYYRWIVIDNDREVTLSGQKYTLPILFMVNSDSRTKNNSGQYQIENWWIKTNWGWITDIAIDKNQHKIFLADQVAGRIWKVSLPSPSIPTLSLGDDQVFKASTYGLSKLHSVAVVQDFVSAIEDLRVNQLPEQFSLMHNYPNPFNGQTTIRYALSEAGEVRIEIYNLLGVSVRTLVHEVQPAGAYWISWDGCDDKEQGVASGVYFIRMTAKDFVRFRKMLFMQ